MTEQDWEGLRSQFVLTGLIVYFNHAAVSPLHKRNMKAMQEYQQERSMRNVEYWPALLDTRHHFKKLIGELIHAPWENIAVVHSTSSGLHILTQGLEWRPGDRVLLNNFEFPANVYPFLNLKRLGVEVDFVSHRNGRIEIEDIVQKMDPRTRVLSISFVEFLNGFRNDLTVIGNICRENDVIFCVDGIQGVGALQMDVQAMGIDFLANGGHKWLMWPIGVGFVYISPRIFDQVYPANAGWLSVENAWDFFNYELNFLPTAERFEPGAFNVQGVVGAVASLEMMLEIGAQNIEKRILTLTSYLMDRISTAGYELFTDPEPAHRSGIVTFYHPRSEALFDFLQKQNIRVSLRSAMIRVSPHFYNTLDEIDFFIDQLIRFDKNNEV